MKYFLLEGLTYMSFFFILCPVGTLLACYSVPSKWRMNVRTRLGKVVLSDCFAYNSLFYKFDEYEKEDSALMFVVFLGWSFCTETYGRSVDG